jgi:hypothetical protein
MKAIKIPDYISDAICAGIIRANIDVSSDGIDVGYHFVLATYGKTSTRFSETGITKRLTSNGDLHRRVLSVNSSSPRRGSSEGVSLDEDSDRPIPMRPRRPSLGAADIGMSLKYAKELALEYGANSYTKGSVVNIAPTASLCENDFSLPLKVFQARCIIVADSVTPGRAISRISTGCYGDPHAVALREWWNNSTAQDRVRVLSDYKRLAHDNVGEQDLGLIAKVPCPFRENARFA